MEHYLFNTAFGLYAASTLFYLAYALIKRDLFFKAGQWILAGALLIHLGNVVLRIQNAGQILGPVWYVPWSNWFECFSFFTLVISFFFFVLTVSKPLPILGAFVLPIGMVSLFISLVSPYGRAILPLAEDLQSHWMAAHVPVMFISYAAFANAFGVGLAFLLQERLIKNKSSSPLLFRLPPLEELDQLIFRILAFAFPLFTMGILMGSAWAFDAWGRYWAWDSKETSALITWGIYLIFFAIRFFSGWRGRKTTYLSILGFLLVLITFMGVNFLSEKHTYLLGPVQ